MDLRIYNTWLSRLRLEPLAFFEADFRVEDGKVTWTLATLFREMPIFPTFGGSAGMVEERVEQLDPHDRDNHYYFPTPVGKPYLLVWLDSHVTPSQRQRAYDFSFWCLVKPGDSCNLPCDYLPLAWQDWKATLGSDPSDQESFNEHYPDNARCKT
jgi:hypothetical protein